MRAGCRPMHSPVALAGLRFAAGLQSRVDLVSPGPPSPPLFSSLGRHGPSPWHAVASWRLPLSTSGRNTPWPWTTLLAVAADLQGVGHRPACPLPWSADRRWPSGSPAGSRRPSARPRASTSCCGAKTCPARAAALAAGMDYFELMGVGMFLDRQDPNPRHAVHLVWAGERVRPEYDSLRRPSRIAQNFRPDCPWCRCPAWCE